MVVSDTPSFEMERAMSSRVLNRFMRSLSSAAVAVFDFEGKKLTLSDYIRPSRQDTLSAKGLIDLRAGRSDVDQIWCQELGVSDMTRLESSLPSAQVDESQVWRSISMRLKDGSEDRIALRLDPKEDLQFTLSYLKRIWPILRQDCLGEFRERHQSQLEMRGTGWEVLNMIDVATLIVDRAGLMYRMNVAARDALDEGLVLKRGKGGVFGCDPKETRKLREALEACADGPVGEDRLVFLNEKDGTRPIPVTLSRYEHEGRATSYIVLMLPVPPTADTVETLVKKMGLTSAEARVAALIQKGLSNREAAEILGLKPETFNTYSKRALNKLNVSCRTKLAQMLTWQAAGGHRR